MLQVNLFIPCFVDQVYPETGINMVKVLESVGCKVQYNPGQTCCGQPAYNAGFFDEAAKVAQKFLFDFGTDTFHYIVAPSASCVGMVKNSYTRLFTQLGDEEALRNHEKIKGRIFELSDFLVNVVKVERIAGAHYEGKVALHDSCSALRECGLYHEPRKLLQNVKGLELVPLPDSESCCGFGGTFAIKFEAISVGMAEQKVRHAIDAGADTIVSTDPSCLMHLEAFAKKAKLPIKVMHIADILATGTN